MKPCIFVEERRKREGSIDTEWLLKHYETCAYCQHIALAILGTIERLSQSKPGPSETKDAANKT
jgi:hypothetical protein